MKNFRGGRIGFASTTLCAARHGPTSLPPPPSWYPVPTAYLGAIETTGTANGAETQGFRIVPASAKSHQLLSSKLAATPFEQLGGAMCRAYHEVVDGPQGAVDGVDDEEDHDEDEDVGDRRQVWSVVGFWARTSSGSGGGGGAAKERLVNLKRMHIGFKIRPI
ncbi:hypothetical protein BKA80DRAFT_300910 [Phyllosticta citrichinensis]